jgi:diguanylate cyclase (GGDEF)-like protein
MTGIPVLSFSHRILIYLREGNTIYQKVGSSFYSPLFQSPIGQIVTSDDLRLIAVNKRMFEYFNFKQREVSGMHFGFAFHCDSLRHDLPCGQCENCTTCPVRNASREILLKHVEIKDDIVPYSFHSGTQHRTKWFQLNGAAINDGENDYAALSFTDVTKLKNQEEYLKKKLELDLATGTINKYSLLNALQEFADSGKSGFSLCMVDFDNFKKVNDQFGHLKGDKVLEVFAAIARKHIRKKDLLGRYGGEEFIFVFPDTEPTEALRILQRIHNELQAFFKKDLLIYITFSAGIIYIDHPDYTCSDLINEVDSLLYRAKKHGRSRAIYSQGEIIF